MLEKKTKEALAMMPEVQKIIDKSVKTGLLKKNTAMLFLFTQEHKSKVMQASQI